MLVLKSVSKLGKIFVKIYIYNFHQLYIHNKCKFLHNWERELTSIKLSLPFYNIYILQNTIGELASISDKEVVTRFFKTTMQKLLKVTQEAGKSGTSKNSNLMQVDNSSHEGSLSLTRLSA